jgi:6,7-dimethyl-8-ribityllumazine synthase
MAEPRRSSAAVETSVKGARFLIVEARFYDDIGTMLLEGAQQALAKAEADYALISVPGALEIPIAMAIALDDAEVQNQAFAGAVALGCILRGETYHFEIVANESARALTELGVSRKLPLGNGILTVENEAQALERASPKQGDKGGDAARAALALHRLKLEIGAL